MKTTAAIITAALMTLGLAACDKTVKTESTTETIREVPGQPDATSKSEVTVVVPETAAPNAQEQKEEVTVKKESTDGTTTETTKKFEVSK